MVTVTNNVGEWGEMKERAGERNVNGEMRANDMGLCLLGLDRQKYLSSHKER